MTPENRQAAFEHGVRESPREACGLVVLRGHREEYFPCRNIAENQNDFIMDPADLIHAEDSFDEVMAVVHSHPRSGPKPSQADLIGCERSGLPWHIVAVPSGNWETVTPTGYKAPLVGRKFVHGITDCYALVRDFYLEKRGVELMDFDRAEEWWSKGGNLLLENFEKAGFYQVESPEEGDVILMQLHSKVINHAAIYLGRNVILHHVRSRLSCRESWDGYFRKNTRMVVRFRQI